MDFKKSINNVANLNGYINFTQELISKRKDVEVPFNMSTMLTLKKIRSLEVEYFSKLQEPGAAFLIFERILTFPPSKTWTLLSVEIVNLLKYWLEAVRKYLITHCPSWWIFFKSLLGIISEIRLKDPSVSNILLKMLAEGLLDLSTSDKLTAEQKREVVACLNQVCSHSSRDIREALQQHCAPYLVKLGSDLACCSHVPAQFATLELLMRWLPNRQDRKTREAAAAVWFPATLFSEQTFAVFVERDFITFFKDARTFLNQHNSANGDIVSVVCRKLTVGTLELISLSDKWESWLDISISNGTLVAMVDVRRLPALGLPQHLRDHLTLTADNAQQAVVYRGKMQIQLSITTIHPPQMFCKESQQMLDEQARNVNIWISSKCHFDSLDLALKKIFGEKYKCDENRRLSELIQSSDSNRNSASEEDSRFSQKFEAPRPRRSGYMVNPKRASAWKSPSTASTTSLAHLQEKLSAFPRLRYDKEPTGICVAPDLSCVTELSEPDEDSNFAFSGISRPCGVITRRKIVNRSKTSPSDNDEGFFNKRKYVSPETVNLTKGKSPNCLLSATIRAHEASLINDTLEAIQLSDDEVVNLLAQEAFATVREKDLLQDSGINVSDKKTKNSNAVETLVRNEIKNNTDKNTNKVPCTVVSKSSSEDTLASIQIVPNKSYLPGNKDGNSNFVISTTTDESNTEAINETPVPFVNVQTRSLKVNRSTRAACVDSERNFKNIGQSDTLNKTLIEKRDCPKKFASNDIEDLFSNHLQENKNGDLVLRPTLARKVNETSSETSISFDKYLISNVDDGRDYLQNEPYFEEELNFVDPEDVLGCLNLIIDKVCDDLDKCAEYMEKETRPKSAKNTPIECTEVAIEIDSDIIPNTLASTMNPLAKEKAQKSLLKLAFKKTKVKKAPTRKNMRKTAKVQSPVDRVITPETAEVSSDNKAINSKEEASAKQNVATKTASAKRKRKLYSPKDEDKQIGINIPETEDDNSLTTHITSKLYTPKTTATSYKEIVKARKDRKLEPKVTKTTRKRGKASKIPILSPRSIKKNEIFDQLKENVEDVPIKLVNKKSKELDLTVYNYTSESEDEDFKAKKIDMQKTKGTPIGSTGSKRTIRSRVNYSESKNDSSTEEGVVIKAVPKKKRAKKATKPKTKVKKLLIEPIRDVIDQRMRGTIEGALNNSFVLDDKHKDTPESDLEPLSKLVSRMEPIPEVSVIEDDIVQAVGEPKKAKKRCERVLTLSLRKDKNTPKIIVNSSANESVSSPLPALIIEPVKTGRKDKDADSISSSKLIKRCENIMKFGEDVDTTQNLLSDDDKICYSPEKRNIAIEPEIRQNLDTTIEDRINICNGNNLHNQSIQPENEVVSSIERKSKLCKDAIVLIKKETAILQRKTTKPIIVAEAEIIEVEDGNMQAESPERSIATVGTSPIRAHGILTEEPPNENMLKQQFTTHRNMESDMSASMNNFFLQLYKEIINSPNENKKIESPQEEDVRKVVTTNVKSTATKNVAKEIQSEQNQLEETLQYTSGIKDIGLSSPVDLLERSFNTILQMKSNAVKPASSLSTYSSPSVVLERLNPEDISKWLPSPKSSISEESRKVTNILNNTQIKVKPRKKVKAKNMTKTQNITIPKHKENTSKITPDPFPIRKSTLSPIRDFDEVGLSEPTDMQFKSTSSLTKLTSPISKYNRTSINSNIYARNITKETASPTSEISIGKDVKLLDRKRGGKDVNILERNMQHVKLTGQKSQGSGPSIDKHEKLLGPKRQSKDVKLLARNKQATEASSSEISIGEPVNLLDPKRKCKDSKLDIKRQGKGASPSEISIIKDNVKALKRKKQATVEAVSPKIRRLHIQESIPSIASSEESESSSHFVDMNKETEEQSSFIEVLEIILEKVDTTLMEIHHNTSKNMVKFFVDMHRRSQEVAKKQEALLETTLALLMQKFMGIAQENIAQYMEDCASLQAEHTGAMKSAAIDLIRADCQKKQAFVVLLREDIDVVLNRERSRES